MPPDHALLINGVYEGVFTEIVNRDGPRGTDEAFLQPHAGNRILMLVNDAPSRESPTRLYASTTDNLDLVSYTAEIVRWEHKADLSDERRRTVEGYLADHQPGELDLFQGADTDIGDKPVNLLTIRGLRRLRTPLSTSLLRKVSDGEPLKPRTRAGGWSEVHDTLLDFLDLSAETEREHQADLESDLDGARGLSDEALRERLSSADPMPTKVQVVSVGYRRNADVIVATLRRAGGICDRCTRPAPFNRRSDGSPYLEVHHTVPLSQGGEDTLENAEALCPNCHREAHHG